MTGWLALIVFVRIQPTLEPLDILKFQQLPRTPPQPRRNFHVMFFIWHNYAYELQATQNLIKSAIQIYNSFRTSNASLAIIYHGQFLP